MVQSSVSAIVFAVAAMSAASSMALPLEQGTGNSGIMNPSAHPSGPGVPPSPSANPSASSVHSSGSSPTITPAPHMSGSAGGNKTQNGSPNQTITFHRTITLAPHCDVKHGSTMGGGDGKGGAQHPSGTPHPSMSIGVLHPCVSAKPSIPPKEPKPPMGRRLDTPLLSIPLMSGHPVESGAPATHTSALHHQSGQAPRMTLTAGQSQTTTVVSKNGTTGGETVHVLTIVQPTGCPVPGDKPGNKGGHGHGNGTGPNKQGHEGNNGHEEHHQKGGNDDHHGNGAGQPKNGQNQNGQGGNNGHHKANSPKATPTQGGNGAGSSGKPDAAQAKGQDKREIFQRE